MGNACKNGACLFPGGSELQCNQDQILQRMLRSNKKEILELHKILQKNARKRSHERLGVETGVIKKHHVLEDFVPSNFNLGSGNCGVVVKCRCRKTGKKYAMKTIPKSGNVARHRRFRMEIRTLGRLRHPNIATLCSAYEGELYIHIVTPIYPGGELFDRLMVRGKHQDNEAKVYMTQILRAIEHCHENGISHRDIKPENFLFKNMKDDAPLVLIDFGFARFFNSVDDGYMRTKCGSDHYIAPEVLSRSYTEKCDVWSAGIILYILLVGWFPFDMELRRESTDTIEISEVQLPDTETASMTEDARSFLRALLNPCFERRVSATEALEHPYLGRDITRKEKTLTLPRSTSGPNV